MMAVELAGHRVGGGAPCFITFELGPTHSGLASALRLVEAAAGSGAQAVKFQIIDPDRLVADRQLPFTYRVLVDRASGTTEEVTEPLYDILCRRTLTREEWRQVKAAVDGHGLAFFATIGFEDEIDFLGELGCHSIKIASADVNHHPLLRQAARSGLNIQLDTGNATIGEIEQAIDVIRAEGNESIIIHHCPSGYPARLEGINLRVIGTLKRMFPYPVAFSDHTPGWEMDVAAVTLGADLVEKTLTEDRTTRSVEHIMSVEPADAARFVQVIREVETALGNPRRILHDAEREKRDAVRRSIHLKRDLPDGHVLAEADLEYRRPGFGIPPSEAERVIGMRLVRGGKAGDALAWADLGN